LGGGCGYHIQQARGIQRRKHHKKGQGKPLKINGHALDILMDVMCAKQDSRWEEMLNEA